jgi:PAS domain S-box-containing protein
VIATESGTRHEAKTKQLVFEHLPGFAAFLRDNHLVDYIKEQLQISKEVDLPLLRQLSHISEDQLLEISIPSHSEFLTCAVENRLQQHIDESAQRWLNDQLGIVGREQVAAEDITLATFIRNKAMYKFLPLYTSDVPGIMALVGEITELATYSETSSTNIFIQILRERINDHAHFIESVANTTPSIIYVFDRVNQRELYTNNKVTQRLGFTEEDLRQQGAEIIQFLVHSEDVDRLIENERNFDNVQDGETRSVEYRIRDKQGRYRWMRAYESVFRRSADGRITEKIGVAIDIDEQKRAEEELQQREQQLLEAQELVNMGSYVLDIETSKVTATPQYLRIFEIEGEPDRNELLKGIHPADRERLATAREKAITENGAYECEYRHFVNGKEKIIWARGNVSEVNGRKMMKGTIIDVTDRHYMIQRLLRSDSLYKQAQALSGLGNWVWDLRNNTFEWSDELYRIYGLEIGTPLSAELVASFNHPDDAHTSQIVADSIKSAKPYDFNFRIVLKDGTVKTLHARGEVMTDTDGKAFKLLGTVQDITKKHLIEQALREKQEFIGKIANTSPSLIASYNIKTGKYTYINNAFEKILGHSVEQVMNEGMAFMLELLHPDDLPVIIEKNTAALEMANNLVAGEAPEIIAEFKYRLKHQDGSYRWFHTYGTVFDRDEHGKVEHVLNVSVDITEQETAEQELYRKNLQLQQSNASLEEYAYVASHDLKEPLRKISTFGDRLLTSQHANLSDDGKLYLEKIINSARRMQAMISDLLSISLLSGAKGFEPYSLQTILQEVTQTLDYKIEEKDASVLSDDLPVANIVPSQFRQLFQNLIGNSLKFVKNGIKPSIHITHSYLRPSEVQQYELAKAKKYLKIDFADNGIGFDNQFANKIFAIFQRLHGKTEYEGTGIGLAICKKIAENHGGTILASGKLGKGAIFTIIIPA